LEPLREVTQAGDRVAGRGQVAFEGEGSGEQGRGEGLGIGGVQDSKEACIAEARAVVYILRLQRGLFLHT